MHPHRIFRAPWDLLCCGALVLATLSRACILAGTLGWPSAAPMEWPLLLFLPYCYISALLFLIQNWPAPHPKQVGYLIMQPGAWAKRWALLPAWRKLLSLFLPRLPLPLP